MCKKLLSHPVIKLIVFSFIFLNFYCIDKKRGSFFPLFASSASPYTPEDLGLPPEPVVFNNVSLPVISNKEAEAMEDMLSEMEDLGLMSDIALKSQSVEAWKTIQFAPYNDHEIDDKIYREALGETVPEKVAGTKEQLLTKESEAADEFFNKIKTDFPTLTTEELINLRIKLTLSLIMIRFQMDYGDKEKGIPEEFLKMTQTKTVAMRASISEELILRGVTNL